MGRETEIDKGWKNKTSKTNQTTLYLARSQTPPSNTQTPFPPLPLSKDHRTTYIWWNHDQDHHHTHHKTCNHRPQKPQWQGRKLLNDRPDSVLVALHSPYHLILIKIPCSTHYYPHFIDEEIAAQGGNMPKAPSCCRISIRMEIWLWAEMRNCKSPPLTPFFLQIYLPCIRITWPVYVKCIFYPPPPDILHQQVRSESWDRILNKHLTWFWCKGSPRHIHRILALNPIKLEVAERERASLPLERLSFVGSNTKAVGNTQLWKRWTARSTMNPRGQRIP